MSNVFVVQLSSTSWGMALRMAQELVDERRKDIDDWVEAKKEGRAWATDINYDMRLAGLIRAETLLRETDACRIINKRDKK